MVLALATAVSAVVGALWGRIKEVEAKRDEWAELWRKEVQRNEDDPPWHENTEIREARKAAKSDPPGPHSG